MITYKWTISALESSPNESGLAKVVKSVHWRYKGTDEASGISYELFGATLQTPPHTYRMTN